MSDEEQFASSEEYQVKVLSYMLSNAEFRDVAATALQHEDFANKALQWFYETLSKQQLSPSLLKEELVDAAKAKKIKDTEIDKYVEYYSVICNRPLPIEEEYIRRDMSRFIRTQATKRAILDSFDLIEKGNWDELLDTVTAATQAGFDITAVGQDYFKEFADRLSRRINDVSGRKLSTGIPELDEMMYGGLKPKQLGLVAGGTGRGKSIFLEWLARVAVLMGETVVYYTLELPEDEIGARFDAMLAHVKYGELKAFHKDVFTSLEPLAKQHSSRLFIKEYPADGATVATLKAHLRQLNSAGVRPTVVIVDYLDLLKPHRHYNSQHEELDAITKALHGMSKELDIRIWTATQLNRAGITMETPDETTVAGALSKLFTVDVALFLAQTKEEREDQIMRIFVAKNRNGPAGRTIKIDTDYAYMTFYRATLGGSEDDNEV
jgi:replicative DNA helicase